MAELVTAEWKNWADGVITAADPELLPATASPRGRNSVLTRVGPGVALVTTRKGVSEINATPITGSPAIIGQAEFKSYASGAFTTYHILVCSNGRLEYKDGATSTAVWDSGTAAPFTSSTSPYLWPAFAAANNCLFICNGTSGENKKAYLEGGTRRVRNWGITRPTVGTMAGAAGAAGNHNGTYELRVTFRNTRTGTESSISNTASATVAPANQQINWSNIPVSADAQVDQRRLWVRNTATMANFYLAGTVNDNSTTTATTNVADTALTVIAPDTAENDPPPTLSVSCWHGSRMFGAGPDAPTTLLYSKLGNPEQFDPDFFEYVNPQDGQPIVGLHSAHGVLIIFKRESTWVLVGDDPNSWEVRPLFRDVGLVAHRAVTTVEGITYWWSEQGPMAWDGAAAQPRALGRGLLAEAIDATEYANDQMKGAAVLADRPNQHVVFALPGSGATRNTLLRPFNYTLQRWSADKWEVMDVASFGTVDDSTEVPVSYIGSYSGQLFKWWDTFADGTPSGTTSGSVTGSTGTTLSDSAASFRTAGNGLVDRYVYAIAADGLTVQRRRISSNTATQLTVASAWTTNPNTTYTYVIGGIDFQFDLAITDLGAAFFKKRLRHLFLLTKVDAATTINVDVLTDEATTPRRQWSMALTPGGATFGTSTFGSSAFGSGRPAADRIRIGVTARTARVRLRQLANGKSLTLIKAALSGELLNDNLGSGEGGTLL
ncbi:MAG TPA: hypothetical protein VEA69_02835 [Tepidisphaeraceae bacterium]|nr:hypothetical protein [Tepidisphaeraceae bacterium]